MSGNNININDFSNENTEANKEHDARDHRSSATAWSLTPSLCQFYKLPLEDGVLVSKYMHTWMRI